MKIVGFILIGIGIALCIVVVYSYLKEQSQFISPIPDTEGVKVILISPSE